MRVLVTGAGGFVGRAVLRALRGRHEAIALDQTLAGIDGIEGDLRDRAQLERALGKACDAVIHLATVAGGAAERDPVLAWQVNVEASCALLDMAASRFPGIRVVYASSIAVFGEPLPEPFDEQAPVAPTMLYGAHKAMVETWLATRTRRSDLRGIALRLPGIVARPRAPSGLASAFLSDLFHALRAGERVELPVSPQATTLLMSVDRAAANLVHALESELSGTWTLPAQHVRLAQLVDAISSRAGADSSRVSWRPDAALERRFGRLPPLAAPRALAAGFSADPSLDELVRLA